jgi:hypothetical protein
VQFDEMGWVGFRAREVFSFNIMHRVYHPALTEVYAVVVVELEEDAFVSNLTGKATRSGWDAGSGDV